MNSKRRIYSLPYNGTNPEWYIQEVEKRKANIDHVYCELPPENTETMLSHVGGNIRFENREKNYDVEMSRYNFLINCDTFLKMSAGKFRRICPINAAFYAYKTKNEFRDFADFIIRSVDKYKLDGLIITDMQLGKILKKERPELELHTSCNCWQWNIAQMEIWQEQCGIKVFNPPREILRSPAKLKEMHDYGFKLKCLINESCLFGCPNTIYHAMSQALHSVCTMNTCIQRGLGDLFRGNYILPRWQRQLDKYVDIYKISGRNVSGIYPFFVFDAYISENNSMPLLDLVLSGTSAFFKQQVPAEYWKNITLDVVPDKLLTCECKNCDKCRLCEKILSKYVPKSYLK